LGWAALGEERVAEAGQALTESVAAFRAIGARDCEAWALAGLGRAQVGLGNRAEAQQHLIEALEIAVEIRAFIPLLHLMPIIPLLLADTEEPSLKERAIELYALACTQPLVAHSRLFEEIAGKFVKAATAALPPDGVEAAQKRGRSLDWWETARELLDELREI
jgi:tetratricopeptide (TPR) repeat protein